MILTIKIIAGQNNKSVFVESELASWLVLSQTIADSHQSCVVCFNVKMGERVHEGWKKTKKQQQPETEYYESVTTFLK